MNSFSYHVSSIDDLKTPCERLSQHLSAPMVIGLSGDMGSGKTTFVRHMCQVLKSPDWVNSPTYSIMQQYQSPNFSILHIDLYRLTNDAAIDQLDIPSSITENSLVFIEWIERTSILPVDAMIQFKLLKNDERELTISSDLAWVKEL